MAQGADLLSDNDFESVTSLAVKCEFDMLRMRLRLECHGEHLVRVQDRSGFTSSVMRDFEDRREDAS